MGDDKRDGEGRGPERGRDDVELARSDPRMSAEERQAIEAERTASAVAWRGAAPDPFEDAPLARAAALEPLGGRTQAFGLFRLPAGFQGLSGQERLDLILDLPDPEATVQALACEEFAFLVNDIGAADAAALLALSSPCQMQAIVDLGAWRDDRFDPEALAGWLAVCAQAGTQTVDRFVASQSEGVWLLLLSGSLRVFETAEEAEQLADPDAELFSSPDNAFVLAGDHADPLLPAVRVTIDALYRTSLVRGRRLLRAVRWELPQAAEEDLYGQRNHRIAEHGFMSRERARDFYAWVDADAEKEAMLAPLRPGAPRPGEVHRTLPSPGAMRTGLALAGFEPATLLGRALRLCSPQDRERLQVALVRIAYRAQAARAEALAASDELARWSRHAFTTCDTGLSWLSDGEEELAARLLQAWPLSRIFGVGHALAVRLHHRARALRRELGGPEGIELLEPEDAAMMEGLLQPLPELGRAREISPSGFDDALPEGTTVDARPFESLAELRRVRERLVAMGAAVRLLSGLCDEPLSRVRARLGAEMPVHQLAELRLTSMLGTAIAWTVLRGTPALEALDEAQARRFLSMAMEPGPGGRVVSPALRQTLRRALLGTPGLSDEEVSSLEGLLDKTLDRLQEELGGLDSNATLDPRFAGAALILSSSSSPSSSR